MKKVSGEDHQYAIVHHQEIDQGLDQDHGIEQNDPDHEKNLANALNVKESNID